MDFLTNLNLNKNELQNAVVQPLAAAPQNPVEGQIYYNSTDKLIYQYNGTGWVPVGELNIIEGITLNGSPVNPANKVVALIIDKSTVGLGNVDNTSDANKPISTATQTALDGKLDITGGSLSGALAMGNNRITGLADGINATDAVTKQQLEAVSTGALQHKGSCAFASLPTLVAGNVNQMYNITDAFTTTSDFTEGAGKTYPAGTNVAIVNAGTAGSPVYKYDAMTGVVDLSGYVTKAGLATGTGSATDNAMTQKAVTDAITGLIKTATGTIGTSATSASVAYSGTLINAYAVMNGELVEVDMTVGASSVTFATAQAPASAVTCKVVYA